jgi:tetratricopeptide (TPR) repeat protein
MGRSGPRQVRRLLAGTWLAAGLVSAWAGDTSSPEIRAAVAQGRLEFLEQRFAEPRSAEQLHLLAQAAANRARSATATAEQAAMLEHASGYYDRCLAALASDAATRSSAAEVERAGIHVEYGRLLLELRAGRELDRLELSCGRQGDRAKLRATLDKAAGQFLAAAQLIEPLYRELDQREDDLLAAGIYDAVIELHGQTLFSRAWLNYYLALVSGVNQPQRAEALGAAERLFRELAEKARPGLLRTGSRLGLALVLREQQQYDEAERLLRGLLEAATDPALAAQTRCELARCCTRTGRFDEARAVLRPLLEKAVEQSGPDSAPVSFYTNLAQVLEADSYLQEARTLELRAAQAGTSQTLRSQAQQARETGVARFRLLAQRGGPWPAIVQSCLAAEETDQANSRDLLERLLRARELAGRQEYQQARRLLTDAVASPALNKPPSQRTSQEYQLGAEILMELAQCCYRLGQLPEAADAFDRLARDYRNHELAPQAAAAAAHLRLQIAQKTQKSEDYQLLAATLLNLLQSFPDHAERTEAAWLYPVALQAAGSYEQAEIEFAKLPADNPHYEEAQWRRLLCRVLALKARSAIGTNAPTRQEALSPAEYRHQARKLADELLSYAGKLRQPQTSPGQSPDTPIPARAAQAYLEAAELLISAGAEQYAQALAVLDELEQQDSEAASSAEALGLRLRALCGLRRFDQIAPALQRYLQAGHGAKTVEVLSLVASTLQEEVLRLAGQEQKEAAAQLAGQALEALSGLEELLAQAPASASRATLTPLRVRMLLAAGQPESARTLADELCQADPQNGENRLLRAQVLTALAEANPAPEGLRAARTAWEQLLADPDLRRRAPQRFWEARYQQLALLLREGQARQVDYAIGQELVWNEDLGGSPWREKLLELRRQAQVILAQEKSGQP